MIIVEYTFLVNSFRLTCNDVVTLWKLFCFSWDTKDCTAVTGTSTQMHCCMESSTETHESVSATPHVWCVYHSISVSLTHASCMHKVFGFCALPSQLLWSYKVYLMRKGMIPPKFWNYTDLLVDSEVSGSWNISTGITWLIAMGAGGMGAKPTTDLRD